MMNEIVYKKKENYKIIGACIKVHAELGAGFLETVYQEALGKQFVSEGVSCEKEKMVDVYYLGEKSLVYKRVLNPYSQKSHFQ